MGIYVTVDSSSATYITRPNSAQFAVKLETAVSCRIWQTVPCENLLQKTVGPIY